MFILLKNLLQKLLDCGGGDGIVVGVFMLIQLMVVCMYRFIKWLNFIYVDSMHRK